MSTADGPASARGTMRREAPTTALIRDGTGFSGIAAIAASEESEWGGRQREIGPHLSIGLRQVGLVRAFLRQERAVLRHFGPGSRSNHYSHRAARRHTCPR